MSNFWSGWIIFLTAANIWGCYWLVRWAIRPRAEEAAEGDVTGHTWDGLQEFNNPLPKWWLQMYYFTIIFAIAYLLLYPGLGSFPGFLGWTKEGQHAREVQAADDKYGPIFAQYAGEPVETLADNPEAIKLGRSLYATYCTVCHGSDAGGSRGFPNLTDKDWLYGGTPEAIKTTITNGRMGVMPAHQAIIGEDGVDQVVQYVLTLSGREADPALAEQGKTHFNTVCAACHMPDGTGNQALGAPNLTDDTWLYGASPGVIKKTIMEGRNGVMPAQQEFLGEDKIHLLTTYVYSLSQDK
ncbi:MAG: cytochrome-c oxidase, cbb3-type subunit III [Gammaproteobacteria bacterium]|nr:cytochrome-c oxidase, cbb3-type subunit III [Gammaproteobacteria bacterium]